MNFVVHRLFRISGNSGFAVTRGWTIRWHIPKVTKSFQLANAVCFVICWHLTEYKNLSTFRQKPMEMREITVLISVTLTLLRMLLGHFSMRSVIKYRLFVCDCWFELRGFLKIFKILFPLKRKQDRGVTNLDRRIRRSEKIEINLNKSWMIYVWKIGESLIYILRVIIYL